MQIVPVDLVGLVSVIMGISVVLVPVIGLTARFALKPTVEALSRFFEHKGLDETVHILERRLALMEQQIESMEGSVRRLAEISEFHHALGAGDAEGGSGAGHARARGPAEEGSDAPPPAERSHAPGGETPS